ncbi:response regulator transcription factor [Ruminiclostridium josui]|uniref:response regulator n=1 Tax=Ruminiclostridium josui TaxID=1499 RepID=UPI000685B85A|nr:response regulator transcription factor [Ruminiclostridium josui]
MLNSFLSQEDDIFVKASANSKVEAVRLAADIKIDVIIMDINLSENLKDGVAAALEIKEFSNAKIIMLTSYNDDELIKDSFEVGAVDYLLKEDYLDLPNTIRKTFNNRSSIQVILDDYARLKKDERLRELTTAEKEVFELMEQGLSHSQIAAKLSKTNNTLRTQVKNILKKLGAKNSKEAIKKIKFKGLFEKYNYKN